jgi:hypothetical protein
VQVAEDLGVCSDRVIGFMDIPVVSATDVTFPEKVLASFHP